MAKRRYFQILIVGFIIALIISCSTDKNTVVSRAYHNVTSHYNVYFNGNEAFKQGVARLESSFEENYNNILPIFYYGDETSSKMIYPDMDKAIKKASKLIKIHSIKNKPKRKKGKKTKKEREFYSKSEYNNWVDDAYLLMGKAQFYKRDYSLAKESFQYLIKEFPNEPIRFEAYLWIARSFIEEENYVKAREILDLVDANRKLPKKYKGELQIIYADYYAKQDKYDDAIPYMKNAIETIKKKKEKARYKFILAQIYQEEKKYSQATELYDEVIKTATNYDMVFNAKMRKAGSFDVGSGNADRLYKELNKMLNDDKNIDYKDQIYYAMAEIAKKQNNIDKALEYYKLSAEKSVANTSQKAVACLAIADIYFSRPEYRNAQMYYDSTLYFIDSDYPDIEKLTEKSKTLTKLITNLDIIDREDSLQMVAGMSEKQRDALIDKIIADLIEQEKKAEEQERMAQMASARFKQNQRDPRNRNFNTGGQWYFYNPTTLSFGQTEFVKLWGRRKLEDNWRRKNKTVIDFGDDLAEENTEEEDSINGIKRPTDPKKKEYYMVDLPLTDSLVALSDKRIIDAFFNVSEIYQNELKDYKLAVANFEELNQRYPGNDYLLFSYYDLYKLHDLLGETAKAESYKSKIIQNYPDSKYAQMFTNPNYLKELNTKLDQVKLLYDQTYQSYINKNYNKVISNCLGVEKNNSGSELIPKFEFLKAISFGEIGKIDDYVAVLNNIVKNYPKSEVFQPAKDMLLKLKDRKDLNVKVELEDENKPVVTEQKEIYFVNDKSSHFFVVIAKGNKKTINRLKFNISNFDMDFFSMDNFNVTTVVLDKGVHLISVKSMDNYTKAMDYYTTIAANPDVFKEMNKSDYQYFVISSDNFVNFYKDKDVERYMKFFTDNYLNRD